LIYRISSSTDYYVIFGPMIIDTNDISNRNKCKFFSFIPKSSHIFAILLFSMNSLFVSTNTFEFLFSQFFFLTIISFLSFITSFLGSRLIFMSRLSFALLFQIWFKLFRKLWSFGYWSFCCKTYFYKIWMFSLLVLSSNDFIE